VGKKHPNGICFCQICNLSDLLASFWKVILWAPTSAEQLIGFRLVGLAVPVLFAVVTLVVEALVARVSLAAPSLILPADSCHSPVGGLYRAACSAEMICCSSEVLQPVSKRLVFSVPVFSVNPGLLLAGWACLASVAALAGDRRQADFRKGYIPAGWLVPTVVGSEDDIQAREVDNSAAGSTSCHHIQGERRTEPVAVDTTGPGGDKGAADVISALTRRTISRPALRSSMRTSK